MNYFRCKLADCKKTQKGKLKAKNQMLQKQEKQVGNA